MSIRRAWIFAHRKIIFILKSDHIRLRDIHERADHRKFCAVQKCLWWKRIKTSFEHQRQQHRLNNIILMMRVSDLIASGGLCLKV